MPLRFSRQTSSGSSHSKRCLGGSSHKELYDTMDLSHASDDIVLQQGDYVVDKQKKETPSQRRKARLQRLGGIFSQRTFVASADAKTPTTSPLQSQQPTVISPVPSSESSYVNWPGTMQKNGSVVPHPPSSSEGGGHAVANSSIAPPDSKGRAIAERYLLKIRQQRQVSTSTASNKVSPSPAPIPDVTPKWPSVAPGASSPTNDTTTIPHSDPIATTTPSVASSDPMSTSSAYMSEINYAEMYQPPTMDALSSWPQHVPGFDRRQDVPALMDNVSDTNTSTIVPAQSDIFDGIADTDVFDGIRESPERLPWKPDASAIPEEPGFVTLSGGLTVVQSTARRYQDRATASDYDRSLTNSDVDPYGLVRTPGFTEMMAAGRHDDHALAGIHGNIQPRDELEERLLELEEQEFSEHGSSFVSDHDGSDWSKYAVSSRDIKKVVKAYRRFSQAANDVTLEDMERREDENQSFALHEMRSRVMMTDMERGLERRGGTQVVDDLVTTNYYRVGHRIRDAVIVSKAWRDGATPLDVMRTSLLTRRETQTYYIKRYSSSTDVDGFHSFTTTGARGRDYYWEPVRWVDDTDFVQYRCPSLGAKHFRGSEIFTVGDCQSILLKLTNQRCAELREKLNEATLYQIEAEETIKDKPWAPSSNGFMSSAEIEFLTAKDDVKRVSKELVLAEKAFALVRDRVEKLIAKYELLLIKIESESTPCLSSVVTADSSYYSNSGYWEEEEVRERAMLARRARRAEIMAELAAREAILAKNETRVIQKQKEVELEDLRKQLVELQSETAHSSTEREQSAILTRNLTAARQNQTARNRSSVPLASGTLSQSSVEDVKRRFRDRMAQRKKKTPSESSSFPIRLSCERPASRYSPHESAPVPSNDLLRSAGEELYSHLDFFQRSLRAVEGTPPSHQP